jgi:hypothetical protein
MNAPETKYFEDEEVAITNTRANLGGDNYQMKNITAVSMVENRTARRWWFLLALAGLIIGVVFLIFYRYVTFSVYLAMLLCIVGLVMALTRKKQYCVRIASSGVETNALQSTDRAYVQKIVDAINQAIANKG